jgi:RNA polymerase sigma-70 factor (ECF subfamily)
VGLLFTVDADAFSEWYRVVYRRVFASVLVCSGDRMLTADAVDEAFARAWERWPRVQEMRSPEGWVFVVARNQLRRAGRRRDRSFVLESPGFVVDPDVLLWQVVRALPLRARELIALRYIAGLTEREVAATLGIAPGTVARGLYDARARLQSMLTPQEDHT